MKDSEARKGIPTYMDDREPEIDDPLNSPRSNYWYPANAISIKLMPCIEAMRDIHKLLEIMNNDASVTDKRLHKMLVSQYLILRAG